MERLAYFATGWFSTLSFNTLLSGVGILKTKLYACLQDIKIVFSYWG